MLGDIAIALLVCQANLMICFKKMMSLKKLFGRFDCVQTLLSSIYFLRYM